MSVKHVAEISHRNSLMVTREHFVISCVRGRRGIVCHIDSANHVNLGDDRFDTSIASENWLVGDVARVMERDAVRRLVQGFVRTSDE